LNADLLKPPSFDATFEDVADADLDSRICLLLLAEERINSDNSTREGKDGSRPPEEHGT
jgi:hypothetical protein